jgi:hypothetical protein
MPQPSALTFFVADRFLFDLLCHLRPCGCYPTKVRHPGMVTSATGMNTIATAQRAWRSPPLGPQRPPPSWPPPLPPPRPEVN